MSNATRTIQFRKIVIKLLVAILKQAIQTNCSKSRKQSLLYSDSQITQHEKLIDEVQKNWS